MSLPTWDEFHALFADSLDTQADRIQTAFFEKHRISVDSSLPYDERRNEYRTQFMAIYGIRLDPQEGMLRLLDKIQARLGKMLFSVETGVDYTQRRVSVDGGRHAVVFYACQVGSDGFAVGIERLVRLLDGRFDLLLDSGESVGGTLEFLFLPAGWYGRTQRRYGSARMAEFFVPGNASVLSGNVQGNATGEATGDVASKAANYDAGAEPEPRRRSGWAWVSMFAGIILALYKINDIVDENTRPKMSYYEVTIPKQTYCESVRQSLEGKSPRQIDEAIKKMAPQCE